MVYVDELRAWTSAPTGKWRYGMSCHMVADSLEELHAFAQTIGLRRDWFQRSTGAGWPHYDLTARRRDAAVRAGAIELSCRQLVTFLRSKREAARG